MLMIREPKALASGRLHRRKSLWVRPQRLIYRRPWRIPEVPVITAVTFTGNAMGTKLATPCGNETAR